MLGRGLVLIVSFPSKIAALAVVIASSAGQGLFTSAFASPFVEALVMDRLSVLILRLG
jgi:hypothetical protein